MKIMEQREQLGSRLGFILLSAGCAIGIGNVWKFPYMVGQYGGGAFVLIYLFFLVILGIPVSYRYPNRSIPFCVGRILRFPVCLPVLSINLAEGTGLRHQPVNRFRFYLYCADGWH